MDKTKPYKLSLFCALLSVMASCAPTVVNPDLGSIYSRSAQHEDIDRNPVIVIPGILGSRLRDPESGALAWGAFDSASVDASAPSGIQTIALPMARGVPLSQLRDDVIPDGVLSQLRLSVAGLPVELDAYRQILTTLGAGGYRDDSLSNTGVYYGQDHFTCFQHAYDWRRDISENAKILGQFIRAKRVYIESERLKRFGIVGEPVKFDIVAHSMGGLLARYYLMYGSSPLPEDGSVPLPTWAGANDINRIVMIGTPNAGSSQAFRELVEGVQFSAIVPKFEAALLGTMPSIYELLPRPRHHAVVDGERDSEGIDIFDAKVWIEREWGLANPSQDEVLKILLPSVDSPAARKSIALDHLQKSLTRAKQFSAAMDQFVTYPQSVPIYLIAGDAEKTPSVLSVELGNQQIQTIDYGPGDGTVLRSSALLDERIGRTWSRTLRSPIPWANVTFLFKDHLALTQDPAFTDNILFLLLEQPDRPATSDVYMVSASSLSS